MAPLMSTHELRAHCGRVVRVVLPDGPPRWLGPRRAGVGGIHVFYERKLRDPRMIRIAIIIGSTRPGRRGAEVAKWVYDIALQRGDAEFELVDVADFHLPVLDEPSAHEHTKPHTRAWAEKIASFDGYVFVTPEYNHATSGALKNALDYLYAEWNNKAAGFVGYGGSGGARAIENLRLIVGELQIADVRTAVQLSILTDFENFTTFKPADAQTAQVNTMLSQLIAWSTALKSVRA